MKTLTAIACITMLVLAAGNLVASDIAPKLVNYQGRLTDELGHPVDGTVTMVFTIYGSDTGSDLLWQETHSNVQVEDGLFTVLLGAGDVPTSLDDEIFSSAERWLGVKVGSQAEISPRTRLVSVPYSQRVSTVDQADAGVLTGSLQLEQGLSKDGLVDQAKLVVVGEFGDSVIISPGEDIGLRVTDDQGDDAALITGNSSGGTVLITASDAAKAAGSVLGSVEIAPGQNVALRAIDAQQDDAVLITTDDDGGTVLITASDAAKAAGQVLGRVEIAPGQNVALRAVDANDDDAVLITSNNDGGTILITASDAAKAGQVLRTVEISPSDNVVLRATEANQDDVVLITADETGGTVLITASDAAKANPDAIVGTVIIDENGIFIVDEGTSDTTLAITVEGDIVADGELAMGENSSNTGDGSAVLGLSNSASGSHSTVAGGQFNDVQADYSSILGGFADTIFVGADYSYLFGINSSLTADSTFMVDMPHIRFGDEATGYEFPTSDGSGGQILMTDGAGQVDWTTADFDGGGWMEQEGVVALESSGNLVGIGTDTPNAKLDVDGNIHASGVIASGNSITIDGIEDEITSTGQMVLRSEERFFMTDEDSEGTAASSTRFINTSTGAYLSTDGIWVNACGEDNFSAATAVDPQQILDKVAALSIKELSSTQEGGSVHISPLAADLLAQFGVGDGEAVSTLDPAGIALAAIQALNQIALAHEQQLQKVDILEAQVADLNLVKAELAELKQMVQKLSTPEN